MGVDTTIIGKKHSVQIAKYDRKSVSHCLTPHDKLATRSGCWGSTLVPIYRWSTLLRPGVNPKTSCWGWPLQPAPAATRPFARLFWRPRSGRCPCPPSPRRRAIPGGCGGQRSRLPPAPGRSGRACRGTPAPSARSRRRTRPCRRARPDCAGRSGRRRSVRRPPPGGTG